MRGLARERLVEFPRGRALEDPGDLGEQIGPAVGELTELGHRGALLVPGQFAPPSVMPRRTGELGDEYTVRFSPQTILVHLARIEHDYAKSNLNSKNIA